MEVFSEGMGGTPNPDRQGHKWKEDSQGSTKLLPYHDPLQIKEAMISSNTKNLPCNEELALADFSCLNDRSKPFHSS